MTAFVDGDRGGQLILKELFQVAEIDFVARAPKSLEVEELTQEQIIKALKKEVGEKVELEVPPQPDMGDYAFPCFSLAKVYKKNPNEIANELAAKIKKSKYIAEIKVIGPYLNFFINYIFHIIKSSIN